MREDIEKNLIAYAQSVIDDEWPAVAAHGRAHPQTEMLYERLWALTYHFEPSTKIQEAYMAEFLGRMNELSAARRLRVLHSRMEIHGVLRMVLMIGAVPTVAYPLLFSSRHAWVQTAITGSIMLIVTLGPLPAGHPLPADSLQRRGQHCARRLPAGAGLIPQTPSHGPVGVEPNQP